MTAPAGNRGSTLVIFADPFLSVDDAFEFPVFVGSEVAAAESLPGFAVAEALADPVSVGLGLSSDLEAFAVSEAIEDSA